MANRTTFPRTLIALSTIAVIGLVLGLLRISSDLINSLLLAWIIVLVVSPLISKLKQKMPAWLAFILTLLATFSVFLIVVLLLVTGINRFLEVVPTYAAQIQSHTDSLSNNLVSIGFNPDNVAAINKFLQPDAIMEVIGDFLSSLLGTISDIVLVIILIVFLLLETFNVPGRIRQEIQSGNHRLEKLFKVSGTIRAYVQFTTVVGLFTGIIDTILFLLLGVDFAILWGILAFLLSYVPTLGFWLAAIPPTILAYLESGIGTAVGVFLGIVLINGFAENVIKPKYMGQGVNLSPFMIIFSVILWAAVLGPMGAILGVPVTILFKETILEADEDSLWIAKLMSSWNKTTDEPEDNLENRSGS